MRFIALATLCSACLPYANLGDAGSSATPDGAIQSTATDSATAVLADFATSTIDLATPVDATSPQDLVATIEAGTFSGSVKPMLAQYGCYGCHMSTPWDGGSTLADAALVTYLTSTKSSECPTLPFVTAGNPSNSYLYQKVLGSGSCFTKDRMPDGGAAIAADYLAGLKTWITNGAKSD